MGSEPGRSMQQRRLTCHHRPGIGLREEYKLHYAIGPLALRSVQPLRVAKASARNLRPVQVAIATPPPAGSPAPCQCRVERAMGPDRSRPAAFTWRSSVMACSCRVLLIPQRLARGSYRVAGDNRVPEFRRCRLKTEVDAPCQRRSATTLYCVPTVGSPFNLPRA